MSTTRTRVKMSNQKSTRNFLRKMRAFKAKHPWITVKPPRNPCDKPKTQRNIPNISVRKDLFENIELHQKIETKTSTSKVVPLLELATELDLECQYTGEFGEAGRGYIGTFEVYTKDNPLGHFQGYIAKKDSGEHWREITECDIFIIPKKEGSTIRIYS